MKMRLLILFALLLPALSLSAQDDDYQLRTPTVEEYLQLIQDTSICGNPAYSPGFWNFCDVVLDELFATHEHIYDQPYDRLLPVYNQLNNHYAEYSLLNNVPYELEVWHVTLIMAWLNDHLPDLDTETGLEFDDLTIEISPRDFNGDGQDEYLLQTESGLMSAFVVVAWSAEEQRFTRIPSSLPVSVRDANYRFRESGILEELYFNDVNKDGIPEWLVAFGGWGGGGFTNGELSLLAWREGELVTITNHSMSYSAGAGGGIVAVTGNVDWDFTNLDADEALEFQFSVRPLDNWGCAQRDFLTLDWQPNEAIYFSHGMEYDIPATMECAIRQAELEFWESNYSTAAMLYEYALTQPVAHEDLTDETRQYAQIRLAQAYLLSSRTRDALTLIEDLSTQTPYSGLNEAFISTLQAHALDSTDVICAAFYNTIYDVLRNAFDHGEYNIRLDSRFRVGIDYAFAHAVMGGNSGTPDPAKAGCDAISLINTQLEQPIYATSESALFNNLESRGILIRDRVSEDVNEDGVEDWLIWNMAHVPPIFLLSTPDSFSYTVSRPNILDTGDAIDLRELVPMELSLTPTSTASPTVNPAELADRLGDGLLDYLFYVRDLFRYAETVELGLQALDREISADYLDEYEGTRRAIQYWKATILLNMNRPNEALADYIAIYESAPDSVWGRLAALHFE